MHPRPYFTRLTAACSDCRDRKVKCSGGLPCKHCQRLGRPCMYPPSRRGKRATAAKRQAQHLEGSSEPSMDNAMQPVLPTAAEALSDSFNAQDFGAEASFSEVNSPLIVDLGPAATNLYSPRARSDRTNYEAARSRDGRSLTSDNPQHSLAAGSSHATSAVMPPDNDLQLLPQQTATDDPDDAPGTATDSDEHMIPLHKVNWEYHGPWSWVSICSPLGVAWVCNTTNSNEFGTIASCFMKTWSFCLKIPRLQSLAARYPEPDPETAWKYVNAYFEDSNNAIFGTLLRSTFNTRLRQHFRQAQSDQVEDPAWFALRNAVYAMGCRCLLANSTSLTFEQAENKAWQLFCNSLSVFGEMVFSHSGLTAIQALTVMTFYANGLASPCIEWPMCKNAVQLAQAKGLHREPSASWGLSPADLLTRNWLWWTIYITEKQVCLRSGRPSSIDDNDISTPIPTTAPPGSELDVEMVTLLIRHAQICSQVTTRIMSAKKSRQGFARAYETVQDIKGQLEDLLQQIPACLDISSANSAALNPNRRLLSSLLYSDVHATIMATHVMFFYPWISSRLESQSRSSQLFRDQTTMSADAIAHSARQIILQLKSHTIDITSTMWATFFHPMNAFINLLLYVLKEPNAATARADLAVLDIAAGHFGQLEHITAGSVSFDFPRDCIALCLRTMRAARNSRTVASTVPPTPQSLDDDPVRDKPAPNGSTDAIPGMTSLSSDNAMVDGFSENVDFDNQFWTIFGSIDIPDEFTDTFGEFE